MQDLRTHFRRFLDAEPGRLHFAAHSHHPWPDATREAQLEAWDTAARLQDGKWGEMLGPVLAECQALVAAEIGVPIRAASCSRRTRMNSWSVSSPACRRTARRGC
jgi:hypothetical protein